MRPGFFAKSSASSNPNRHAWAMTGPSYPGYAVVLKFEMFDPLDLTAMTTRIRRVTECVCWRVPFVKPGGYAGFITFHEC
jgi:hypothetical protein